MRSDVIIVGGGIIGLYSAYLLANHGIKPTIIDRGLLGNESTFAAGGILSPLLPWDYSQEIHHLTDNAAYSYEHLSSYIANKFNYDIQFWQCGLKIYSHKTNKIESWCRSNNCPIQITQPSKKQEGYAFLPHVAQVHTPTLIHALIKLLQSVDVQIFTNTRVTNLSLENNKIIGVETSQGIFDSGKVIWSIGAWASKFFHDNLLLKTPHIKPIKGQVITFSNNKFKLDTILFKQGHYLIPRKDGIILAGSTLEDVGYDKRPTEEAKQDLWSKSLDLLPELIDSEISHHWTGLRPASENNIPTIGPHPDIEGLFFNCGHYRYGLTMAPKSAEILSDWVINHGNNLSPQDQVYSQFLRGESSCI